MGDLIWRLETLTWDYFDLGDDRRQALIFLPYRGSPIIYGVCTYIDYGNLILVP